ncbi:hypothetical protein [Roseinatronobacter monicus]|uniref:Uncharacterized protein n=1 Tax=Roseinatronobacter monicus TaxID=393481 RepID=A0A543K5S8_9RHOB|nr:hypothetical protein [Roseinatronobacter monicus]TQM90437.1 hypothetical protein BD293_3823 [Roseinatronobacter monicus]
MHEIFATEPSETLSAAQEAIKRGYNEFKEGLSHAYRQIEDLENRTEAATRTIIASEPKREMLKEEIAKASQATVTLQAAQEQAHRTLKQAKNMLLGAVILIVLSLLRGGPGFSTSFMPRSALAWVSYHAASFMFGLRLS